MNDSCRSPEPFRRLLRVTAERDQLALEVERLRHAMGCLQAERDEARDEAREEATALRRQLLHCEHQLEWVRADMASLLHAVAHAGERLKALVRRQFGSASERLHTEEHMIPEILECIRAEQAERAQQAEVTAGNTAPADNASAPATQDTDTSTTNVSTGTTGAAPSTSTNAPENKNTRRRPANAGGRRPLPEDIERRQVVYQPPGDHPALRNAAGAEIIGQTTIERWCIGPLDLYIEQVTCPVARIVGPTGMARQETLAPPSVIPRSQVSDDLLVSTAVDRIVDHLPTYRQEQRFARHAVHLPRAKLCRWHIALADFLTPLSDAILGALLQEPVLGIDDSVRRLLVDDRRTCKRGRLWAVAGRSGAYYCFTETREGKWITQVLQDYSGAIMGDAYSGHHQLLARDDIMALFCWAHVRRKFYEAADKRRRQAMLLLIAQLYAIEDDLADMSPADRTAARQHRARPILRQIKGLMERWVADPAVLPQSGIGKACTYALKIWDGLVRYCDIGEAPIDNNRTERCMRPNALDRKNSLFSASLAGAHAYATLLTITQSAHLYDLNPVTYLNDVIEIMHYDRQPVSALIPSAYVQGLQRPDVQPAQFSSLHARCMA